VWHEMNSCCEYLVGEQRHCGWLSESGIYVPDG
jgi:hypothetical protein